MPPVFPLLVVRNKYENKYLNVIIRKPKIEINNDNYKYLQLIDLIENKDNIYVEVDYIDEIIYNFIQEKKCAKPAHLFFISLYTSLELLVHMDNAQWLVPIPPILLNHCHQKNQFPIHYNMMF